MTPAFGAGLSDRRACGGKRRTKTWARCTGLETLLSGDIDGFLDQHHPEAEIHPLATHLSEQVEAVYRLPTVGCGRVRGAHKTGGEIVHELEPDGSDPPSVGDLVQVDLEWARRFALMRTHTALHALCGVVWRDYGAQVTGGNMEPGSGRMDFEFERMSGDLVDTIEAAVNAELAAARDVRVAVLPRAEAFAIPDLIRTKINLLPEGIETIRTIEIVGLDLQADGGTHVSNTREVGGIQVTGYESKGRINKRIRISLTDG